jgi:hypothetical protein
VRALVPLVALVLFASAMTAAAQEGPVTVRTEVDRTTMAIGDQVLLTVTVEAASGYRLLEPGIPRAIGDFEVIESLTVLETRGPGGVTRTQLRFLLTAFALGPKRLPPVEVTYRGPDGANGTARTRTGHVIAVESVVQPGEDTSDIKPLKPPLALPGTASDLSRFAPHAAIAALVLVAAALALRIRRRGPVAVEAPAHGPARTALDELERVAGLGLAEKGRMREHYELVAAAVRTFTAQRYGLAAHARTARELRRELERAGAGGSAAQLLCEVLADAEAVRYEERPVSPAQAKRATRDLIELMRKSVVAEEYELVGSQATA